MNKCIFMGRLTKDPEIRYLDSGMAVAKFSIAVDRLPDKNGNKATDFIPVTAFGKQAETVGNYLSKGRQVLVEAHARIDKYTDKDTGENRWSTSFMMDRFEFCGSAKDNNSQGGQQQGQNSPGGYQGQGGYNQQGYSQQAPQGRPQQAYGAQPQYGGQQPIFKQQSAFDNMGEPVPFDEEIPF